MERGEKHILVFLVLALMVVLTQLDFTPGVTGYATEDSKPTISEPYVYGGKGEGQDVTISVDIRDPDGIDFAMINIHDKDRFMQEQNGHYTYTFTPSKSGEVSYKIYAYDNMGNYNQRHEVFNVLAFNQLDTDGDGLEDDIDSCPKEFAVTPDGCPGTTSIANPAIFAGVVIAATIVFLFFKYSPDVYQYFQNRGKPPPSPPPSVRLAGIKEETSAPKPLGHSLRSEGPVRAVRPAQPPSETRRLEYKRSAAKPSIKFRPKLMRIKRPNIYLKAPEGATEEKEEKAPQKPEAKPKAMKRPVGETPVHTTISELTREQVGKDVIIEGHVKFIKTFLSGDHGYTVYDRTGKILATSDKMIKGMKRPGLIYARVEEAGGSVYLRITAVKK